MANELEFIINNRSIRGINTTTNFEYFSVFIDQFRWKRSKGDDFSFYNSNQTINAYGFENLNRLGINQDPETGEQSGVGLWGFGDIIDPETGLKYSSADDLATWLGANTGFFFNPNPANVTINGIDELIANDGENIILSLQVLIEEQIKTNKLLTKIYNPE